MCLFLSLLPTDLQVHVLCTWIGWVQSDWDRGLVMVRSLSALDKAVCRKALRADCLALFSQIPAFGEQHCLAMENTPIRSFTNYFQWLSSRKVAVKSLLLLERDSHNTHEDIRELSICLPSVEGITCPYFSTAEHVEGALRLFPNLTHLTYEGWAAATPAVVAHVPNLKMLTIADYSQSELLAPMLMVLGSQLRELRLNSELPQSVSQQLHIMCPLLEILESAVVEFGFQRYEQLLRSCMLLRDLSLLLRTSMFNPAAIVAVVMASLRLKRFAVRSAASDYADFAVIRELRPDMECLEIGEWRYAAAEGSLFMRWDAMLVPAMVTATLKACPNVKTLEVIGSMKLMDVELAEVIVQHLQGCLQSLSVYSNEAYPVELMVRKFAVSLKSIKISGNGTTNELLRLLAEQCPLLEAVGFHACDFASNDGIISVLTGCPQLKVVRLSQFYITAAVLRTIINRRLRLNVLKLTRCGLFKFHEQWFRQQVKDHQLLPLPMVDIDC